MVNEPCFRLMKVKKQRVKKAHLSYAKLNLLNFQYFLKVQKYNYLCAVKLITWTYRNQNKSL